MNINGFARSIMSKQADNEKFLKLVATCIERQLQEWDKNYEVIVMKMKDYEFTIRNKETEYCLQLSENEAALLQQQGPYRLDRRIWEELRDQGLPIQRGYGNYIDTVL